MRKIILTIIALFSCLVIIANGINPLRLHIIANSNSLEDQQIKLEIRDCILKQERELLASCKDKNEAIQVISSDTAKLEQAANQILREHGKSYTAHIQIGKSMFPDKNYGTIYYPAGEYDAVRVILGEGSGENWWCVMFPPLCLVQTEAAPGEELEYTSLLLTWLEKLFS